MTTPHRFFSLPLLPFVLSLILGALLGGTSGPWGRGGIAGIFLVCLAVGYLSGWIRVSWIGLLPLAGCFLLAAFTVHHRLHPSFPPNHIARYARKGPIVVEGRILSPLDPGLTHTSLTIAAGRVFPHGKTPRAVTGKIRLTLYGPPTQTLYVGDRVRFAGRLFSVRPPSNPDTFNYRRYLALRNIYVTSSLHRFNDVVVIEDGRPPPLSGRIDRIRQHLNRWMTSTTKPPFNALLSALLIGYRGRIPDTIRAIFRKTGTSHLIAISGLHLGIVGVFLFVLIKRLAGWFPGVFLHVDLYRITAFFTFWLLLFYLLLTGSRISTLRAFIMAATFLAVLFFRRTTHLEDVLILSAFVLLLFQPQAIFDTSFQLTFAAVGGILLGVPETGSTQHGEKAEKRRFSKALRWVGLSLWITVLAMAATFPIVGAAFHRASPMGILANLLAIPLLSFLILPIGITALIFHPLIPPLANVLLALDARMVEVLLIILRTLSRVPHAQVYVFPFRWDEVIFYYLSFIFAALFFRKRAAPVRKRYAALALGSILLLSVCYTLHTQAFRPSIELFSVRKGVYFVASDRQRHSVILCYGLGDSPTRDDARRVLIPYLTHERLRSIHALVVANPEPVNLRAAATLIAYSAPTHLLGTRPILESLNMVWHPGVPRNRWVTSGGWISGGSSRVRLWSKQFMRKDIPRKVEMTLRSLRTLLCLSRCPGRLPPWKGSTLLVTSKRGETEPPPAGRMLYVLYPKGDAWYRSSPSRKDAFNLRVEGALSVRFFPDGWRVQAFSSHRETRLSSELP